MHPEGLKIGFSPDLGYARVQRDVLALAERTAAVFMNMGHQVEIWKGSFPDVGPAWSDLMNRELCGQLYDDLERIRPELGHTLAKSLENAKDLSFEDRVNIQKNRTELNRVLWDYFNRFDLLLTPAMPTEAFAAKGPPPSEIDGVPIPLLGAVAFTYPFNLSGHPAATVRTGLTESGMPAGLQIVGPRHRDDLVLQAAHLYEQARPWKNHWPDF
jgi:aspartyl-tRNA(Asn)/glutamyl-tRNA(Gln) amidotransferase subunit A